MKSWELMADQSAAESPFICCKTLSQAVVAGHLKCLEHLHARGSTINAYIYNLAAQHLNVECLEYCFAVCNIVTEAAVHGAASRGSVSFLQKLFECDPDLTWPRNTTYWVAHHGNVPVLKYIFENHIYLVPWEGDVFEEFESFDSFGEPVKDFLRSVQDCWKNPGGMYLKPARY